MRLSQSLIDKPAEAVASKVLADQASLTHHLSFLENKYPLPLPLQLRL